MHFLAAIGQFVILRVTSVVHLAAVASSVVAFGVRPSAWPRTVRYVLARQVLFTGVEAVPFVAHIAVWVGLAIVVQAQIWVGRVGLSDLLGPVLVGVLVRELGPLLCCLVVVGRSGNAIAAEIGNMKVLGEVRLLESHGIDPLGYLLMPRAVAMMVSVFGLTSVFIFVTLASGFLWSHLIGEQNTTLASFVQTIAMAVKPADFLGLLAKTLLPGLLIGCIACIEGLSVGHSSTEVPPATSRSTQRSVLLIFVVNGCVSALTYL